MPYKKEQRVDPESFQTALEAYCKDAFNPVGKERINVCDELCIGRSKFFSLLKDFRQRYHFESKSEFIGGGKD